MEKEALKTVWYKLDDLQNSVSSLMEKDLLENTIQQLKREDKTSGKMMPLILTFLLLMMAGIAWVSNAFESVTSMAGIAFIVTGGMTMIHFMSKNRVPFEEYEANGSVNNFIQEIKGIVAQRKHYWAAGVIIYLLSLTFGLHLLIFGLGSLVGKGGTIGTFYGIMLGIAGAAGGSMYALHNKIYGDFLKTNF